MEKKFNVMEIPSLQIFLVKVTHHQKPSGQTYASSMVTEFIYIYLIVMFITFVQLKDNRPPNINCVDAQGNSSLHCASYRGHKEAAVLLLQNGIDTGIRNTRGEQGFVHN
jgi:ankyrin repeat protein